MLLGVGEARGEDSKEGILWSHHPLPWGRERLPGEQGINLHMSPQGQAQECLLEKSMLDNRKSFLVARISAQVETGAKDGSLVCP